MLRVWARPGEPEAHTKRLSSLLVRRQERVTLLCGEVERARDLIIVSPEASQTLDRERYRVRARHTIINLSVKLMSPRRLLSVDDLATVIPLDQAI